MTCNPLNPAWSGPVLSGNITEHSTINMHVFADSSESVGMRLDACGIYHQSRLRRHSIRRGQVEEFPGYEFFADDFTVEATVFPERRKGHAPLSPVDGKPMRRARSARCGADGQRALISAWQHPRSRGFSGPIYKLPRAADPVFRISNHFLPVADPANRARNRKHHGKHGRLESERAINNTGIESRRSDTAFSLRSSRP